MKTKLNSLLTRGAMLTVAVALGSIAFAGPGSQYWQQQEKLRAENAAKAKAAAVAKSVTPCSSCRTMPVLEFSSANVSGKYAPNFVAVGSKHECATCGGAITTVHDQTTSNMTANCPICAKAKASGAVCCTTQ